MVLVTDAFVPSMNGVVRAVTDALTALPRAGVAPRVIAPAPLRDPPLVAPAGARFHRAVRSPLYPDLYLAPRPVRARDVAGADVVHVHTPGPLGLSAVRAASRAGVPVVYSYHTRFEDLAHCVPGSRFGAAWATRRVAERVHRAIFRRAAAVIAPTDAIADELDAAFGVHARVVPSGVDVTRYRDVPPPADVTDAPPTIVHVGRLSREKNVDALLHAWPAVRERLPGARLLVAGAGPDAPRLRALARERGLESVVRFLGFVPDDALPALYARADVYATASAFETQGLTVYEALAAGTPVAVADAPAFAGLVRAGVAERFDARAPEDVAHAIARAYRARHALAPKARAVADAFSTDACARSLAGAYADVTRTGR